MHEPSASTHAPAACMHAPFCPQLDQRPPFVPAFHLAIPFHYRLPSRDAPAAPPSGYLSSAAEFTALPTCRRRSSSRASVRTTRTREATRETISLDMRASKAASSFAPAWPRSVATPTRAIPQPNFRTPAPPPGLPTPFWQDAACEECHATAGRPPPLRLMFTQLSCL